MPGTCAELASRFDLAALGDIAAQAGGILVVDFADLVDAEAADFAAPTKPATATATTRSTSGAARPASATWAAPTTGPITATRPITTERTIPAERAIATKWTVALRPGSKPAARCFTIRTAPSWAVDPLSWSVIAHRFLSFLSSIYQVIARLGYDGRRHRQALERRLAIVPGNFLDRSQTAFRVLPASRSARRGGTGAGTGGRTKPAAAKATIAIRPRPEELKLVGGHVERQASLALLILVLARLQATINVDLLAFRQVSILGEAVERLG